MDMVVVELRLWTLTTIPRCGCVLCNNQYSSLFLSCLYKVKVGANEQSISFFHVVFTFHKHFCHTHLMYEAVRIDVK